jgi:hypothetical protein
MAKSGLESALSPSGDLLSSPEDDAYKTALQKMKSALDVRENRMFDPQLLAMAQGFLAPTKTGSFGESVGQAAGNVIPVMQAEEKAGMENAQLRLQIAQAERAQANKLKALGMGFGGAGQTPTAPTGGAAPTQGGQQSATISVGGQQFPAFFQNITPEIALRAGVLDEATGKMFAEYLKLRNEGFKVQPGGFVDVNAPGGPKYTPFGGKALVQRVVPGVGKIDMPEEDAMALDEARRSGDGAKYWSIVDAVSKPMSRSAKPAAPTSSATPAGAATTDEKRTTASTLEADAAAAKERATKMATSEAERTNMVMDAAKGARGAQAGYTRANEILADQDVQKNLGVLNRGDFTSALGNLVSEAFRVGNYSVGIPAIKEILQKSGLPQETINKLAELGQIEAMWQMESRKGLGAGTSVSNMEQMMANRITPNQDDPYGAYKQKLQFLQEKSKFDIQLAREMKRNKLTYDEFEDTDAFDKMFKDYQSRLMSITTGKPASGQQNKPTTQTGPITPSSLRDRLNPQKPPQ